MSYFKVGQLLRERQRWPGRDQVSEGCYLLLGKKNGFWQVLAPDGRLGLIIDSNRMYEVVLP